MLEKEIKLLRNLVNFNTTSSVSNASLIDYVCDQLDPIPGVDVAVVDNGCDPSDPDTGILKAALVVRMGPKVPGGIMLSAHTDCVPVNVSEWHTPPFTLTEHDGRLYGRGSTDMKGFIACALAEMPSWGRMDLQKPIYLVLSYDEEIGCLGVDGALRVLKMNGIEPDLCIVGEPTEMQVAFAHKTRADINLLFSGTGGHASKIEDPGITCANTLAAGFLTHLKDNWDFVAPELHKNGVVSTPTFAPTAWQTPATHNVIAARTAVHLDYRGAPGITAEKIAEVFRRQAQTVLEQVRQIKTGRMDIGVQVRIGNKGFFCEEQDALALAQELSGGGRLVAVDYVCEAAKFSEAGFTRTVVCGPGSIKQAHQPNEFVEISQLAACARMMKGIGAYCGTATDFAPR